MDDMIDRVADQVHRYGVYPSAGKKMYYVYDVIQWAVDCQSSCHPKPVHELEKTYDEAVELAKVMSARAAIEAMREPTPAMVKRGWELILGNLRPEEIWPHMIDAALREKP